MGSFQQIVMGGICLVAVFWFGSYINEHPAHPQHPLQGVSNSFVAEANSHLQVPSQQLELPQGGLLSSFIDASTKPRPITLSELKSRSTPNPSNVVPQNFGAVTAVTTEVVSDFVKPPTPDYIPDPSFKANNHSAQAVSNDQFDQQRLEIIPNFSTLAEDFRREQAKQFRANDQLPATQTATAQRGSMLPVPKLDDFSRASLGNPIQQPDRDWNAVRQGVMSVEEKLKQFHNAHPVAEEFEPLRASDARFPVAATATAGRFIPERRSNDQEADRLEAGRLEESLREYEQQELARQEIQRQKFLNHRPQEFVPRPSWRNPARSTERSDPRNQLRTENQFAGRGQVNDRGVEPAHRPAPPESFAQRQERWKVFGDRTRQPQNTVSTRDNKDDRSYANRSVEPIRTADVSTIAKSSQVRSFYAMPVEPESRFAQPERSGQAVNSNRNPVRSPTQHRRTVSSPLTDSAGPEVIRYKDFRTYRTEGGDTLQKISESFFGTPDYYFDLYLANRNVLANPATVPIGVELKIPRMGE